MHGKLLTLCCVGMCACMCGICGCYFCVHFFQFHISACLSYTGRGISNKLSMCSIKYTTPERDLSFIYLLFVHCFSS